MKCPSCAAAGAEDAAECPSCGLIFAKWRERQEREKLAAEAALAALELPPQAPPLPDPSLVRGIAAGFVGLWLLVFGLWVRHHMHGPKKDLGADTGAFVEMRDRKTGEMRRLPIFRVGGEAAPPTAGYAPAAPAVSEQ